MNLVLLASAEPIAEWRNVVPTSEHGCHGSDKQDAGRDHQNLDGVIVWSVTAWTLDDWRGHDRGALLLRQVTIHRIVPGPGKGVFFCLAAN